MSGGGKIRENNVVLGSLTITFLILTLVLAFNILAFAEVSESDKQDVYDTLKVVVDSVNSGETKNITELVSPNASPELKSAIEEKLFGNAIRFAQDVNSMESVSENKIKVKGRFGAEGTGWNISGLSNFYTFEKIDGQWYLLDTDFHKKLGADYVYKFVGMMFAILIPFGLFWLWMLIDSAKSPIENKTMWILLIVFLNILGAILYFFIPRRAYKRAEYL